MMRHYIILFILSVAAYVSVLYLLDFRINQELMFFTSDAKTYLEVAQWLLGGEVSEFSTRRPFLYPLFVIVTYVFGNIYVLWFSQFVLWLLSIQNLFKAIKSLTGKTIWAYAGALTLMSNATLIFLTLNALTEVLSVFVLSSLVLFISKYWREYQGVRFFHGILLHTVLLALIKPMFYYIALVEIILMLSLGFNRFYKGKSRNLLFLFLIFMPIILQHINMMVHFGQHSFSSSGKDTYVLYLFARTIQFEMDIPRDSSQALAETMTESERSQYARDHISRMSDIFLENVHDNVNAEPILLREPEGNIQLHQYMNWVNYHCYRLHLTLMIPVFLTLLYFLRVKDYLNIFLLAFFYCMTAYMLIITGFAFYQGDRYTIPPLLTWIPTYIIVADLILEKIVEVFRLLRN